MTNLPPELAEAERLLRDLVARRGSKERIYWQVMARQKRPGLTGSRWALVAACLFVSATAMGFGVQWAAQQKQSTPSEFVATGTRQPDVHAPQRQKIKSATPAELAPRASADHEPATDLPRQPVSMPSLTPREAAALRSAPVPAEASARTDTPNPTPTSAETSRLNSVAVLPDDSEAAPRAQSAVAPSELSQQVADYAAAVAWMRSNPSMALERLRAHRERWPRSAIVHEVDLRIIEALVALGRRGEAGAAARVFLQRYPGSAFSAEARQIVEEGSVR